MRGQVTRPGTIRPVRRRVSAAGSGARRRTRASGSRARSPPRRSPRSAACPRRPRAAAGATPRGSCQPVSSPSTTRTPHAGEMTWRVQPGVGLDVAERQRDGLQRARDARADGDHAPAARAGRVDEPRRRLRDGEALRVRRLARLQRRHARVQRERRDDHAFRDEPRDELVRERASRARHLGAAGVQREDRLVVVQRPVAIGVRVADRSAVLGEVALASRCAPVSMSASHRRAPARYGASSVAVALAWQRERLPRARAGEARAAAAQLDDPAVRRRRRSPASRGAAAGPRRSRRAARAGRRAASPRC